MHIVCAEELYRRVLVGLRGKIGVGRYNSTTGRKSPLFNAGRQIDPENFGQGFKSGRRQEVPWVRDPRALVLDDGPHFRWERCAVGRFTRDDLLVSQGRVVRLDLVDQLDMCHLRCFKFNRQ